LSARFVSAPDLPGRKGAKPAPPTSPFFFCWKPAGARALRRLRLRALPTAFDSAPGGPSDSICID
jgi:hypothetical protein